jgi:hypothetical protein
VRYDIFLFVYTVQKGAESMNEQHEQVTNEYTRHIGLFSSLTLMLSSVFATSPNSVAFSNSWALFQSERYHPRPEEHHKH